MSKLPLFDSPEIFQKLKPYLKTERFSKGAVIEESGFISKRLFFIQSGLIRVFYRTGGKEVCCHFAKEGEILTGIDSFFTGNPSIYTTQCIEETVCHSLTKEQLEWAFDHVEGMNRMGREFVTYAYIDLVERYNSVVTISAQDRYQQFMQTQPEMLNRIPLGYLSTYLGMSQETLSRIRAQKV